MRPDRFERLLTAAINRDGRLTARTYTEVDFTRSRRGIIAATPTGAPVNLQIVAQSFAGDNYDEPEGKPITGDPHPPLEGADPIQGGKLDLASVERYLATLAVAAASEEIQTVSLYQNRDKPGAVRYGVTFSFHSGAYIYLYVLHAGRDQHQDFVPPALVSA